MKRETGTVKDEIILLSKFATVMGIALNDFQLNQFEIYMDYLLKYNKHTNLTSITEPSQIVIKHFLDSLLLTISVDINNSGSIIDVGTGAGFPGVPVKIVYPNINLTLLDSLNKRLVFLESLIKKLNLNADIIHNRAENGGSLATLREKFDCCTSRAVASLNILAEYCLPYLKIGGMFAALKGPNVEDDIKNAKKSISLLGGALVKTEHFELPDRSGQRSVVLIKKISHTDAKYPRSSSQIAKKPL